MSKTFKKNLMVFFCLILAFSSCLFAISSRNVSLAETNGFGKEIFSWQRNIDEGVVLNHSINYNQNKEQRTYTIDFDPKTASLQPYVACNDTVMFRNTLSDLIDIEEAKGNRVLFGINGDGYDSSNGIPYGLVINEGRLIASTGASVNTSLEPLPQAFGFYEDNTIAYGSSILTMEADINGATYNLSAVNRERKTFPGGLYLLTEDFADKTYSVDAGVEVRLAVDPSNPTLKIGGGDVNLTVKEIVRVQKNSSTNQTLIGDSTMVLSTHIDSPQYNLLSNLPIGSTVKVRVNDPEPRDNVDWSRVKTGMGIFHTIVQNGQPTLWTGDYSTHPRTAMGVRADGSIIIFSNDGRQTGWSNGYTFGDMADYFISQGCVSAFNFDGGGSTSIAVTMPGEDSPKLLNRPSDIKQRANSNALLFIQKDKPVSGKPVQKLHLYPNSDNAFESKAMVLKNGQMQLQVKATDENYYPVPLGNNKITYSVQSLEGNIGSVDQNGLFTASTQSGKGMVNATNGVTTASFQIEVIDTISKLVTSTTLISLKPGESLPLKFKLYKDGLEVYATSKSLDYKIQPSSLGRITNTGEFLAQSQGVGTLTVSYGNCKINIPVEVGKLPQTINDFEQPLDAPDNPWHSYYTNIGANGGSATMTTNFNKEFVKYGDGSLKIDYDFLSKPLTGNVAIEIGQFEPYTVLPGSPEFISAWIYGDGNGGKISFETENNNYFGDTIIDWTGWQYVEIPIPKELQKNSFVLVKAFRFEASPTTLNHKKGAIYVDSLRAVYGFKNDDNLAPIMDDDFAPIQDFSTSNMQQPITFTLRDAPAFGNDAQTGLASNKTQLFVNGVEIDTLKATLNQDGSVSYLYFPGAIPLLNPGIQEIEVRAEDNFGNKSTFYWSFNVEGYAIRVHSTSNNEEKLYTGQEFEYSIIANDYRDFDTFDFALQYNKRALTLTKEPQYDSRATLESKSNDSVNGLYQIKLNNMKNFSAKNVKLLTFNFKVKDSFEGATDIKVNKAIITDASTGESRDFFVKGVDKEINYKYVLFNSGSTKNSSSVLKVIDENGQPVEGATICATKNNAPFTINGLTDKNGELVNTSMFQEIVGTVFNIYAKKGQFKSQNITMEVCDYLGTLSPENIILTTGVNPSTSVGISWQTSKSQTSGEVRISTRQDLSDPQIFTATSTDIVSSLGGINREYTSWGAYITNLNANTIYYYSVGVAGHYSAVKSFITAKNENAKIAFYGDINSDFNGFLSTIKAYESLFGKASLNLIAGDLLNNSFSHQEWLNMQNALGEKISTQIWASTVSNSYMDYGAQAFASYFYAPNNGANDITLRRNYYFEVGDIAFFNFDTNYINNAYFSEQLDFLKKTMNASTKTFKVVLMNKSPYSQYFNDDVMKTLIPHFEQAKIDLVLSGNDKTYSRSLIFNNEKNEYGINYVVAGSSSGAMYNNLKTSKNNLADFVYDDNNPTFSNLSIENGLLVFKTYAVKNNIPVLIDSFTISPQVKVDINVIGEDFGSINHLEERFVKGKSATLNLTANDGCYIKSFKVNGVEVELINNSYTIDSITESLIIDVVFAPLDYKISVNNLTNGTLIGDTTAPHGSDKTFTIKPNKGYEVMSVMVNGTAVNFTNNTFIVENITSDISIHIIFKQAPVEPTKTGCNKSKQNELSLLFLIFPFLLTRKKFF